MAERKKILIIGEVMLDKTITVSKLAINKRSCETYKKKKAPEFTFGGVFFISRYLQHFQNVDITVININPKLTKEISEKFADFSEKFEEFPENNKHDVLSECINLRGSSDYIHSITRFMTEKDQQIYFQIEDYYAPNNGCTSEDKKRYTYSNAKKRKLLSELKSEIDGWIEDNQDYDRRILLMDYDLGLFDEEGLLNEIGEYFNEKNNTPVIIYSGKKFTKFNSFKNAHIVTYSKDASGEQIKLKDVSGNIKKGLCCFSSLVLVSSNCTIISIFPSTMKENIKEGAKTKTVETEAWGCDHDDQIDKPRTGHKAIIAAHLAMTLTTDDINLLNIGWLDEAHKCSKEIANELLTKNFIIRDWKKNIEKGEETINNLIARE